MNIKLSLFGIFTNGIIIHFEKDRQQINMPYVTYKDVHYLMHAGTGYLSNLPLSLVSQSKTLKLW